MKKNYEIVAFKDGEFTLDVRADFTKKQKTVWLTQEEIAKLSKLIKLVLQDILIIFMKIMN